MTTPSADPLERTVKQKYAPYSHPNPDQALDALDVHLISCDGDVIQATCSTDTENNAEKS